MPKIYLRDHLTGNREQIEHTKAFRIEWGGRSNRFLEAHYDEEKNELVIHGGDTITLVPRASNSVRIRTDS